MTLAVGSIVEEFAEKRDCALFEVVDGVPVEKSMSADSQWIAFNIAFLIASIAAKPKKRLGWVSTEWYLACFQDPNTHSRRPDVSYFRIERMPTVPRSSVIRIPPDLCVEVLSPHDDVIDVENKIAEYLLAGVPLVWIVNPALKTLRVHRLNGTISQYASTDTVTGEDILPDFSVQVAEFFPPE